MPNKVTGPRQQKQEDVRRREGTKNPDRQERQKSKELTQFQDGTEFTARSIVNHTVNVPKRSEPTVVAELQKIKEELTAALKQQQEVVEKMQQALEEKNRAAELTVGPELTFNDYDGPQIGFVVGRATYGPDIDGAASNDVTVFVKKNSTNPHLIKMLIEQFPHEDSEALWLLKIWKLKAITAKPPQLMLTAQP